MKIDFTPEQYFDLSEFPYADVFQDVVYVWEPLKTLETYLAHLFTSGKLVANYQDAKDIFIGEGSTIEEGVRIIGPAVIGKRSSIGHAAFLRGGNLIGDGVHVGHAVELKSSIILNHAAIAHLNYVGNSIVGNANISGGAMFANYRLDKRMVIVKDGDEKIETGLQKFGAIVGDGSNIGAQVVLNPGTILGKHTVVYPLKSVVGVHTEGEVIN